MPVDPLSKPAAAVNKHPGVLAIAIEDRVDLWFSTSENHLVKLGEEIPPTGGTFLDAVHELLKTLIQKLVEKLQTTHSQPAEQLFRCIGSTVVSIPGAVHRGTTLVQIGLLGTRDIQWGLGKKKKTVFDFPKELSTIICSGSHLKLAGLAFSAVSSSDYLPLIERAGSDYLHLSLHSTPPARIPS